MQMPAAALISITWAIRSLAEPILQVPHPFNPSNNLGPMWRTAGGQENMIAYKVTCRRYKSIKKLNVIQI
jgi:hypothetical protein